MLPILFEPTATTWATRGIGTLASAKSVLIDEKKNSEYELEMEYPITGIHYSSIEKRSIILAKPNDDDDPQPFRVYKISRELNGIVTISARHISYDMSDIPCAPFEGGSLAATLTNMKAAEMVSSPFTFSTDKTSDADFRSDVPGSMRSMLGGREGSILDVYGGWWHYDGYAAELLTQRGENRGVTIRYGKNLTQLKQEENCESVYTGAMAFWKGQDGTLVSGTIQYAPGVYEYSKIKIIDASSEYETQPAVADLNLYAALYITNNRIYIPRVNLDLSYIQLSRIQEKIALGDTVRVIFEKLGVSTTAEVIETVYDCLAERYTKIEIGDAKSNIADSIYEQNKVLEATVLSTKTLLSEVKIEQDSIKAIVAEYGNSMWQIPAGTTVDYYGTGAPTETEGYTAGDVYLDYASGYLYTFNGTTWTQAAQPLEAKYYQKYSAVEITANGIDIKTSEGQNLIALNQQGILLSSGAALRASTSNLTINADGSMTLNGSLYVNGSISTPDGTVSFDDDGITMSYGGGGGTYNNWDQVASPIAVFG